MNTESICTMCSKVLDEIDKEQDFHFKQWIGYGSKHNLNIFEARLCCDCFDKVLDAVLPMFKSNPLTEYEIVSEDKKLIARRNKDER
jgi:hypothetical protein